MTISLPMTLAIIDGLVVRLGAEPYVFPAIDVEECRSAPRDAPGEQRLLQVRGELVPYYDLRSWFGVEAEAPEHPQILVSESRGHRIGFVVDEVVGQHQAVIKSLGSTYAPPDGVSGATILGDGDIALVLDPNELGAAVQTRGALP